MKGLSRVQARVPRMLQAMEDAGLKKSEIDEVVLVGGSTRIPKVRGRCAARLSTAQRVGVRGTSAALRSQMQHQCAPLPHTLWARAMPHTLPAMVMLAPAGAAAPEGVL